MIRICASERLGNRTNRVVVAGIGRQAVDLAWTGAAGDVDIRRDDSVISTQSSSAGGSGTWTDNIGAKGGGSYSYQVCDAGTTACSPVEVVVF